MTQSYIVLLTRRTDAENAVIRCLSKQSDEWVGKADGRENPLPASDSLRQARLFSPKEANRWIEKNRRFAPRWCMTVAPAGEETGVPGEPGTSSVGPETDAVTETTKPAERSDVARLGGRGKQGRGKDERQEHRGTAKS